MATYFEGQPFKRSNSFQCLKEIFVADFTFGKYRFEIKANHR